MNKKTARGAISFLIFLMSIFFSYGSSANLYNIRSENISEQISSLVRLFGINVDVVVLDSGDRCVDDIEFIKCIRETYDDSVDLIFAVNLIQRKMETSIRESMTNAISLDDARKFEEFVAPYLQEGDVVGGLSMFLTQLGDHFERECEYYGVSQCTGIQLIEAKQEDQLKREEQSAERKLDFMIGAFGLLITSVLFFGASRYMGRIQRNKRNTKMIRQLQDHASFLRMSIHNDQQLFASDKKDLLVELSKYEGKIESLASSSHDYITIKLQEENYTSELDSISQKYRDLLEVISTSRSLTQKIDTIKKINL